MHALGGDCDHIKAFWTLSIPTSKKYLCWRVVGLTCLKHTGEDNAKRYYTTMHYLDAREC